MARVWEYACSRTLLVGRTEHVSARMHAARHSRFIHVARVRTYAWSLTLLVAKHSTCQHVRIQSDTADSCTWRVSARMQGVGLYWLVEQSTCPHVCMELLNVARICMCACCSLDSPMPCPLVTESNTISIAGLSTRRPVRPPTDSRRGSDPVFHGVSNCLDNLKTLIQYCQ